MKPINLKNTLKPYKFGGGAINDKTDKVVAHANSFDEISKRMKKGKDIYLMPAADNYFGFITPA